MKKGFIISIIFSLLFVNLKPFAYALPMQENKTRFVLFCMMSNASQSASCKHKVCPLMDKGSHSAAKGKNQSCDTRLECSTTHNQETTSSFGSGDVAYIHNISLFEYHKSEVFLKGDDKQTLISDFYPAIDKPPINII